MGSFKPFVAIAIGMGIIANTPASEPASAPAPELSAKMFRKCRSVEHRTTFWVVNPGNGTLFVASNRNDGSGATLIATLGDTRVYAWNDVYLLTTDNESYTITITGRETIDYWFCHPLPITDMEDE